MVDPPVVRLPAMAGGQAASWAALVEVAPLLGEHWVLVGGQMVFLHEVERGATDLRPTDDVDVVADLRLEPGSLDRVHRILLGAGFSQDEPSPDGVAHRFRRRLDAGLAVVDVLAPDHLEPGPTSASAWVARSRRREPVRRSGAASR